MKSFVNGPQFKGHLLEYMQTTLERVLKLNLTHCFISICGFGFLPWNELQVNAGLATLTPFP
jgi:hypothetical protein